MAVYDDGRGPALYAGGYFTNVGGVAANGIAKWDGSSWSALGSGVGVGGGAGVSALAVYDDGRGPALYAGGYFTSVGGQPRNNIAAIDAPTGTVTGWNPGAFGGVGVFTLAVSGSTVYVGGEFTFIGGARHELELPFAIVHEVGQLNRRDPRQICSQI